jgi:molecular chaperone GrpE (heat shock protein)
MKKFNYFYKTTNIINEKFYYGVHSSDKDNDNYLGSGKLLLKAIKKYGRENFKREIIQFFDSFDDALSLLNIDMYILLNMN